MKNKITYLKTRSIAEIFHVSYFTAQNWIFGKSKIPDDVKKDLKEINDFIEKKTR